MAGRQSGFENTEKRADFAIFKDIDIEAQLAKALEALLGKAAKVAAEEADDWHSASQPAIGQDEKLACQTSL